MAARKSSRVNRKYKTKYRVTNWREYERGLRSRGDITVWFSGRLAVLTPQPLTENSPSEGSSAVEGVVCVILPTNVETYVEFV